MKGSSNRGGICNAGGERGTAVVVDEEGGGVDSLRSGVSEMEMYVDSSMRMGVGVLLVAMNEGSGWRPGVEILSFYLGGGGVYGILGSAAEQIRLAGIPMNCQLWDILST